MQLRYNYRVYPTPGQQASLSRAFGCARVVFNDGLRARQQAREAGEAYLSDGDLSKRVITQAKQTPEREWLGEVSAVVLQQALADLNVAYRNFFTSISGKRQGRKVAPPRFRSRKDNRQAIRFTANARFKVLDNGRLRLPKIGDLAVRWSRHLPAAPTSVTVIRDAAGRYSASFVVVAADDPLPPVDAEVGIDLGLTHFAVLSNGTKVAAPKFLRRAARKLRRLQQDLSRKQRGSNNRKRPSSRSPARTLGWPTADGTGSTSSRHGSSATTKRCTSRTYASSVSAGPGWPNRCTTRAGRSSCTCWSTRPPGAGGRLQRPTGSCPRRRHARRAAGSTDPSRYPCGRGPARAGPSTTGTSTRPETYSRRDAPRA
ncbi:transposase [Micromonospora sp. DPT]|uniref:RNA-guided endonuclease InsQ/TnpB family protein n=1 Tax=Micromonospora sp. DPT TaxID=3142975 RepID=UPI00320AA4FC